MAVKQATCGAPRSACLLGTPWLLILLLLTGACSSDKNQYIAPPPPQVTVSQPVRQPVTDYLDLTGNLQAYEAVNLVARVEGFLTSIQFKDGEVVKKGQPLFVIEPQPYEAKVALQQATVEQQKASLLRAEQEYARQLRLIKDNATSQTEVEKWRAERDAAKAALDEARANAELAEINLGYTRVTAPFDGRMERHLKDVGNLVGAGEATQLATIYRFDPIYAYFNLNERDLVRLMKEWRDEKDPSIEKEPIPVHLAIAGDDGYPHQGTLDYASAAVSSTTGTLQLRAIFENPLKGVAPVLLPGMFARLRIPADVNENALLVPDSALGVNQGKHYLLVVNAQNTVEQRAVEIGALVDEMRVIGEGLKGDEWVVVDGVQRARPGAKVTPVHAGGAAPQGAAPASTAPAAQPQPSVKP